MCDTDAPASLIIFLISLNTSGNEILVFHWELTVLWFSSGAIVRYPFIPKICDHFLQSASCANHVWWVWLILKDPYNRLPFIIGIICTDSRFITCVDLIHFWHNTIVFDEHFFAPIDMSLFWSIVKLCGIQRELNFFVCLSY